MGWIKSIFDNKESLKKYANVFRCPHCDAPTTDFLFPKHVESDSCQAAQKAKGKEDVHPLIKAIDDGHEVTMTYRSQSDHPDTMLEPRTVIPTRMDGDFVVAFDTGKNGWRKFFPGQRPGPGGGNYGVQKIIGVAPASIAREDLPPEEEKKPAKSWKKPAPTPEWESTGPAQPAPVVPKFDFIADDAKPWLSVRSEKSPMATVEPTEDEYNEIKSLDIDPDTFDRAVVKRLRNMGVTHAEIKDALTNQTKIPIEDYETARINNPDSHLQAVQEAVGYQDFYSSLFNERSAMLSKGHSDYAGKPLLSRQEHDSLLEDLFGHHLTLKNLPTDQFESINPKAFTRYHSDSVIPWRRRASEWVMSECAKLNPSLRNYFNSSDPDYAEPFESHYDADDLLKTVDHSKIATKLHQHYNVMGLNARTIKDHVIASRKQKALANITGSQFLPYDYSYDQYEEEPRR